MFHSVNKATLGFSSSWSWFITEPLKESKSEQNTYTPRANLITSQTFLYSLGEKISHLMQYFKSPNVQAQKLKCSKVQMPKKRLFFSSISVLSFPRLVADRIFDSNILLAFIRVKVQIILKSNQNCNLIHSGMIKVNIFLCMYAWKCTEICNNMYDATNWNKLNFPPHPIHTHKMGRSMNLC